MKHSRYIKFLLTLFVLFLFVVLSNHAESQNIESGVWQVVIPDNSEQPVIKINTQTGTAYKLVEKPARAERPGEDYFAIPKISVWWPISEYSVYKRSTEK